MKRNEAGAGIRRTPLLLGLGLDGGRRCDAAEFGVDDDRSESVAADRATRCLRPRCISSSKSGIASAYASIRTYIVFQTLAAFYYCSLSQLLDIKLIRL